MDKASILVSGATLFKEEKGADKWFIVRSNEDSDWEFPKITVRKAESSVRAILRLLGEKGGLTTKVLEETGRSGGVATVGSKTLPQRHIYYLMILKGESKEAMNFPEFLWLDYSKCARKLSSKREKQMLKKAREELKNWKKLHPKRKRMEEEAEEKEREREAAEE